jgi:uncharacterized membrane protein YgdD (TMEM256/DUF423 family)
MTNRTLTLFAALSAAIAITAGAFGAHGVSGQAAEWLKTGGNYQLVHAVAGLVLAARFPRQAMLLLAGAGLFAATLYLMAMDLPRWLGAVTPIGGVMMIAGWLWVAAGAVREVFE